jgi:putative Holliday junction resolvase
MRYLGVDLGRARIGVALADKLLRTARPLTTLPRRGDRADAEALRDLAQEWEVSQIVVGLPFNMDGSEGPSARLSRTFAGHVERTTGLPVALFDERLSTFEAEDRLRAQGFSGKDRRARVDAEAAAVILQGWLDGRDA